MKYPIPILNFSTQLFKSYGGFLSAYLLFQPDLTFKCAVSGAPVADWKFYDTAYTERFLGLYNENSIAYHVKREISINKTNTKKLHN